MLDWLLLLLFVAFVVVQPVALVWAAVLPSAGYDLAGRSKQLNIVLVLLTGGIGAVYFLVRVRPEVRDAARPLVRHDHVPIRERWRD